MSYFPLMIQLGQTPVLLVGGGKTARRKASILKEFGASVDVVAPSPRKFGPLGPFCTSGFLPKTIWNGSPGIWWWQPPTTGL